MILKGRSGQFGPSCDEPMLSFENPVTRGQIVPEKESLEQFDKNQLQKFEPNYLQKLSKNQQATPYDPAQQLSIVEQEAKLKSKSKINPNLPVF